MTIRLRTLVPVVLLAVVAGTVAAAAQSGGGQPARYLRYSLSGDATHADTNSTYRYRGRLTFPGSWRFLGRNGTLRLRFGPIGSCRIMVTVTGHAVSGPSEDAVDRLKRALPAAGRYVLDQGTRGTAAFRVIREKGKPTVRGYWTRLATTVKTQPAGGRIWLDVRAVGAADPKVECHSGGPRTVGDEFGNALAGAGIGGFQFVE